VLPDVSADRVAFKVHEELLMDLEPTKMKATCLSKRRKSPGDAEWFLVNIFRKQLLFFPITKFTEPLRA
jgi:hypothetical protein